MYYFITELMKSDKNDVVYSRYITVKLLLALNLQNSIKITYAYV